MIVSPNWTDEQLREDSDKAISEFRNERLDESLEKWKVTLDQHRAKFRKLFDQYGVANPSELSSRQLVEIFRNGLGDALRYLSGPPISEDDLKTLAETSLAPRVLEKDVNAAKRVVDIVARSVDTRRFPWIHESRAPTKEEKAAAILASAALSAAQRVSTDRRSKGKTAQESAVKACLRSKDLKEVQARKIRTLADAPEPGEFSGECMVGSRKADIVVRLFDGRLMPIECKVSNSSTNSVKRLNNDAQVKASVWRKELGENQIVPAAVLSGVFKVHNLKHAQDNALTLYWAHRLQDIWDFIRSTKS